MTTNPLSLEDINHSDYHHDNYSKTLFGFWLYLMTDCIVFSIFFATYAVLYNGTWDGPKAADIFDLNYALIQTIILLTSSLTCGLSMLALHRFAKSTSIIFLLFTFIFGTVFLGMELFEFHHLVKMGYSWERSAFLSSFFSLVGCHGLHITCGLFWIIAMIFQLVYKGITENTLRRMMCFGMFWHFLDLVWIFIFTFVYLVGVANGK